MELICQITDSSLSEWEENARKSVLLKAGKIQTQNDDTILDLIGCKDYIYYKCRMSKHGLFLMTWVRIAAVAFSNKKVLTISGLFLPTL